ncbi:MAG: hypothetical protein ACW96M_03750 [Candidatus Thorarchaeota archaeon]|jgi:hypothetical protein
MIETPLDLKSQTYSQGIIFIVVLAWCFMGFEIAQYRLLNLYELPFEWIAWATFLFVSMFPVLVGITWRMKTSVSYTEPTWDFREREITLPEYENMMKQYRRSYQHILSIIDFPMIFLAAILFSVALLFPFALMRTTIYLIAATPVIFGLLVLLFGIVFANITFKYIPNAATPHFPYLKPGPLRKVVRLIEQAPGISWTGVHTTIGEAGGYFTVREPRPLARIEDIESVARIECDLSDSGDLVRVVSVLQLEGTNETILVDESLDQITPFLTAQIVQKTLLAYVEARGESELLEEVLEDVEDYLRRFVSTS